MDDLRWILSAIAVVVIAAVFFLTRSRKKEKLDLPLDAVKGVPSFGVNDDSGDEAGGVPDENYWGESRKKTAESAAENAAWVDNVGPVRVVSAIDQQSLFEIQNEQINTQTTEPEARLSEALSDEPAEAHSAAIAAMLTPIEPSPEELPEVAETEIKIKPERATPPLQSEIETPSRETTEQGAVTDDVSSQSNATENTSTDDVIAVYVLASTEEPQMKGDKILSAGYALHLQHGEMNIFHRIEEVSINGAVKDEIQFSMANLQEPGWFDIEKMNQLETQGLSFFMQVNLVENPSAVLDEMLICAHKMSTMLGAKLCSAQRQLLDEAYTNHLRNKVKQLIKAQQSPE